MNPTHFQPSDPGLTWIKDEEVSIDLDSPLDDLLALTPNVITLPDQTYRMYYTGGSRLRRQQSGCLGFIVSASSSDGMHWKKDAGIRVDAGPPHADLRTFCPDVISLSDGSYRMYFQTRQTGGRDVILSAQSSDGLRWQREKGVRIANPQYDFGSPRCLSLPDGKFRLFFHQYHLPDSSHGAFILSAISENGLDFTQEPGYRIAQETLFDSYAVYAPEVLELGSGGYRMYYAAWQTNPMLGRIFSAFSQNSFDWIRDDGIRVDCGGKWDFLRASEPCIARLTDGRYRMYYEACDKKGVWRIASATTPD